MAIEDHYGRDAEDVSEFDAPIAWRGGITAGFIATVSTSLVILLSNPSMFSETIAGMYGLEGVFAVGLVAHLIHGTLFGFVFAAILSDPGLLRITNSLSKTVMAGVIFGLTLAIVGTGFLLPVWTQFVGLTNPPEIPWITLPLFGWHGLYGVVLGLLFPFLEEW